MKKNIVTFAVLALPAVCGSGEYSRTIGPDTVIENRAGQLAIKHRSDLSKRLEAFARIHGADDGMASEMAELLAALENGKPLAAIAAQESRFDIRAYGKAGEMGAYQVRPKFWGHPGDTFKSQTDKADQILEQLLNSSNGNLKNALEKYNGKGRKSRRYATSVLLLMSQI